MPRLKYNRLDIDQDHEERINVVQFLYRKKHTLYRPYKRSPQHRLYFLIHPLN